MRSPVLSLLALPLVVLSAACGDDDSADNVADAGGDVGDAIGDAAGDGSGNADAVADAVGDAASDVERDGSADAEGSDEPFVIPPATRPLNGVEQEIADCASYAQTGPYDVGMTTIDLDGVPVEIWYPAAESEFSDADLYAYDMREWLPERDRNKIPDEATPYFYLDARRDVAASTDGPFPVVLFSHGLAGYRMQSATMLTHIASWGYVVAAPDHPERGLAEVVENIFPAGDDAPETLRALVGRLELLNDDTSSVVAGILDLQSLAVSGHSAGGGATFAVAGDEVFDTFISYAAGSRGGADNVPLKPGLLIAGDEDGIVSIDGVTSTYEVMAKPRGIVSLAGAGHLAFSDLCVIGRDRGGILAIAADYGIRVAPILQTLGSDGCQPEAMPAEVAWPWIHHTTVAHLEWVFGRNPDRDGLDEELIECLGAAASDARFELEDGEGSGEGSGDGSGV